MKFSPRVVTDMWQFILGLVVGATLGFFACAILSIAKNIETTEPKE